MIRTLFAAVAFAFAAPASAAAPSLEEIAPEFDGFVHCSLDHAMTLVGDGDVPDAIAEASMTHCAPEFDVLTAALTTMLEHADGFRDDPAAVKSEAARVAAELRAHAKSAIAGAVDAKRAPGRSGT